MPGPAGFDALAIASATPLNSRGRPPFLLGTSISCYVRHVKLASSSRRSLLHWRVMVGIRRNIISVETSPTCRRAVLSASHLRIIVIALRQAGDRSHGLVTIKYDWLGIAHVAMCFDEAP